MRHARWTVVLIAGVMVGCATEMQLADATVPQVQTTPLATKGDKAKLARTGPNKFQVTCEGIQTVAVKQREPTWCWAACAEMLNRYNGVPVTQEQMAAAITKRKTAGVDDQSANQVVVWLAMNPERGAEVVRREAAWESKATVTVHAEADFSNLSNVFAMATQPSSDEFVQEISQGHPVMLGLHGGQWGTGHIVLVYGVEYSRLKTEGDAAYKDLTLILNRGSKQFAVHNVMVVDPQPDEGKSQLVTLTATDLQGHVDFAWGKAEAAKKLQSYMDTFMPTPDQMAKGKPLSSK